MIDDALRAAYESAWVEITLPAESIIVPPVERGTTPPLPELLRPHVHIITAFNPRSVPLGDDENEERQRDLARALDRAGWSRHPALGRDERGTWREPSFAVVAASRSELLVIAGRFDQNAVYEWGSDQWRVLFVPEELRPDSPPISP